MHLHEEVACPEACPDNAIVVKKQDWKDEFEQKMRDDFENMADSFENREIKRQEWMNVFDCLPPELHRDTNDMIEMMHRVADGKSLTVPKKLRVNLGDGCLGRSATRSLSPLTVHDKTGPSLSPLGKQVSADEWVEVEITVDSGACDTVMPTSLCTHISILQTAESRAGLEYEVANGETIPNVGERKCLLMSEDSGTMKKITFQCADIHKPLLSVSRCADLGFSCVLEADGGKLVDKVTGEIIPLHRRGNLYVMRAWIRQDKTVSPASPFGRQR